MQPTVCSDSESCLHFPLNYQILITKKTKTLPPQLKMAI